MKFLKYIEVSSKTEEEKTFRSLSIGIVKEDSKYQNVLKKYDTSNIISSINKIDSRIKSKIDKGYKLGLYVDECASLDTINSSKERILTKINDLNNALAIIQKDFETSLQNA